MALLEVKNLGISFGGLRAVDGLNLRIEKGTLYGLIGPNGAGKTTVFNLLTGVYKPTIGTFALDGEVLNGKSQAQINHKGIARTFQNIQLFQNTTVLENVAVDGTARLYYTEGRIVNPGHDIEGVWFLLEYARKTGDAALVAKAEEIFNWAITAGWDKEYGGLLYFVVFVLDYNRSRFEYWLNPWADAQGSGYQLSQSLLTIGSGGLLGVGLGKSRQKFLYLPEEHNDFIFAIVCEELGLIGATVIMLLFAALILRGFWIALHARDRFGSLMVVGVVTLVGLQTFLNIGVVTGLLPTTGISLPFFSYGGTALSIQLAEMGIVLSVSRQMKPTKAG